MNARTSLLTAITAITLGGSIFAFQAAVQASDCAVPSAPACGESLRDAIPDDGQDDRCAIQAALDTQGCAELVSGVYDISNNPASCVTTLMVRSILISASAARL